VAAGLGPGETYTSSLDAPLPPAKPGAYHILVRPDGFDEVYEAVHEANNPAASADTFDVTAEILDLNVPLETTLDSGQTRLYQVEAELGQTLRVRVFSPEDRAANEVFLRYDEVPTGTRYDAAHQGPFGPNQSAIVTATQPGAYYVLVRGHSQPADDTPVTILADLLPFSITDVTPDSGGDVRWMTTTIRGAPSHPEAVVKLVRPGFAEYEAANYQVIDGTTIVATFDLRDAPRGLYDLKVVNPSGEQAVVPYRYLVERAIEPDVAVAMGGPRVLAPGDFGTYSLSVRNRSNVDLPYVYFQFGVPELGHNEFVYNFRYVTFASNLRGAAEAATLQDLAWASLDSAIDAEGIVTAHGYALDLPAGQFAGLTFDTHTYPGLRELADRNFDALRTRIYQKYPEYVGLLDEGPSGLAEIDPLLLQIYESFDQLARGVLIALPQAVEQQGKRR